jgi:CRP-like cAMP-binding protein
MAIGNHGRSMTDVLKQAEVFGRLGDPELRKLRKLLRERHVDQNQVVFRQGDQADALYIVLAGRLRISVTSPTGHEKVLNFAGVGDVVGEMGLLSGDPRSATATTTTDAILLQLRKADFDSLLAKDVDFMRELARVIARRREATQQRALDETSGGAGRREGLVSVVFSPRGGAGTTTIATNLAVALAHRTPDRVVLVDLNVLFGHVPLLLNLTPRTSLSTISAVSLRAMDRESFEFYLTTHADTSLRVLSAVLRPEDGELINAEQVRAMLDLLRRHFAYVIVDMGRSFSEVNLAAIELADNILIVCTSDRVGIRAVTETQRIFRELLRLPGDPLQYVLNHPSPYTSMAPEELEQTLQARFVASIPFGGDAPARAALEGRPVVIRWPNSAVSKSIQSMAVRFEQQVREAFALAAR